MTLTETIVNRIAQGWRSRRTDRRSVLAATAVIGSALATHPLRYATRPVSAYASVCGPGAACEDGWSVFCCSINGANQCPPGSFVGGWWKADQSGFCCGSARYYVDCNASCGSDWKCHCGSGSCDQRRVACNQFRYGQCHQEIDCYGPVVCRVVTCTPPWQFDRSCTSLSLTDNRTVLHSAPCLPGDCPSAVTKYYYDHGGPGGPLGPIVSADRAMVGGGRAMSTKTTMIYQLPNGTVHELSGALLARYRGLGASHGRLGEVTGAVQTAQSYSKVNFQHGVIISWSGHTYGVVSSIYRDWIKAGELAVTDLPVEDEVSTPLGIRQQFRRGVVYQATGSASAIVVGNRYFPMYLQLGLAPGRLGLPTANEATGDRGRKYARFRHGGIYWTPSGGPVSLDGALFDDWVRRGAQNSPLGYPTGAMSGLDARVARNFERGALFFTMPHGSHLLNGTFWDKWRATSIVQHTRLGLPITDRFNSAGCIRVNCQYGAMIYSADGGTHIVYGPVYDKFVAAGAEGGKLGPPTTDIYVSGGKERCDFRHGTLTA